MSLLFNLDDSAVVEKVTMKWPSDDYFIPAGTPMSREGIANDENAVGVLASPAKVEFTFPDSIARLIGKKEPKGNLDYTFDIITAGFVDIKKAEASFGGKIGPAAKSAMAGIRFIESASDLGGDYFEIKIDWEAMTCKYSASEIRQAYNDGKPFIGDCVYDATNFTDEENNVATIAQSDATSGNKVWKYTVHEDKTVEEYNNSFRLLENDPVRITVSSSDTISGKNTAAKLTELINRNDNIVPIIYLIKDNFIYYLVYFEETSDTAEGFFRFACITSTSVKIAEITGTNTAVTFTEKLFS